MYRSNSAGEYNESVIRRHLFPFASAMSIAVFIATAVLWVMSYSAQPSLVFGRSNLLEVTCGRVAFVKFSGQIEYLPDADDLRTVFDDAQSRWEFLNVRHSYTKYPDNDYSTTVTAIPIIFVVASTLILPGVRLVPLTLMFWQKRRRTGRGLCPGCSYDLTGNTSGTCPECGTRVPTSVDEPEAKSSRPA